MPAILTPLLLAALATSVAVPFASAPEIDGTLAAGEWDAAARYTLADGTILRFQHDGTDLFVALQGPTELVGSLCLLGEDGIEVLHASHALARAVYHSAGTGRWTVARPFDYGMRETDFSEDTRRKRAAYLEAERWIANTTRMGDPGVREYRLAGLAARGGTTYLRAAWLPVGHGVLPAGAAGWPESRRDACDAPALVHGETPEPLLFEPFAWAALRFTPA